MEGCPLNMPLGDETIKSQCTAVLL